MKTVEATRATSPAVIVHARFAPDGVCIAIGECPAWASPQQWFKLLSNYTVDSYRTLSGGRGMFSINPERLEELKSMQ